MSLRKSRDRERLADALAAVQWEEMDFAGCPDPEQIWRAGAGELPPAELASVADHASNCAVCAHDLRAARQVAEEVGELATPEPVWRRFWAWVKRSDSSRPSLLRPVMAMVFTCAVGAAFVLGTRDSGRPTADSSVRAVSASPVTPLVADRAVIDREDFALAWHYEGEASFDVQVTTQSLVEVAFVEGLSEPAASFDKLQFADFEPGTALFWRVIVHPAEGEQFSSHAFRVVLE